MGGLGEFICIYRFKSELSIKYPFTPTKTFTIFKSDNIKLSWGHVAVDTCGQLENDLALPSEFEDMSSL